MALEMKKNQNISKIKKILCIYLLVNSSVLIFASITTMNIVNFIIIFILVLEIILSALFIMLSSLKAKRIISCSPKALILATSTLSMLNLFLIYLQAAEFGSYSSLFWEMSLIFILCYSAKKKKRKHSLLFVITISRFLTEKYAEISAFIIMVKMLISILNNSILPSEYKLKLKLLPFPCFIYQIESEYCVLDNSFNFVDFSFGIKELLNRNQKSFEYELPQFQSILKGRHSTLLVKQISKLLQFLSNYRVLIQQAEYEDDFIQIACIQNLKDLQNWIKANKSNQQLKQWNFLKIYIFKQNCNYFENFLSFNKFFEFLKVKMLSHVNNQLFTFLYMFFSKGVSDFSTIEIHHMLNGLNHHFKLLNNSIEVHRIGSQLMEMKKNSTISQPEMSEYYNPSSFKTSINELFKPMLDIGCHIYFNTYNFEGRFINKIAYQIMISIVQYIFSLIKNAPIIIEIACVPYKVIYSIIAQTKLSNMDIEFLLSSGNVLTLGEALTCQTNFIWELNIIQNVLKHHNTKLSIEQEDSKRQIFSFDFFEPKKIMEKVIKLHPRDHNMYDLLTNISELGNNDAKSKMSSDFTDINNTRGRREGNKISSERKIQTYSLTKMDLIQKKSENCKEEKESLIPASVLIVEDDPFMSESLALMIKHIYPNINIIQSRDGQDGYYTFIKYFEPKKIRLIFMDGDMPNMNGPESARRIYEFLRFEKKQIPIIALTANEDMKQSFQTVGVKEICIKPIKYPDLKAFLDKFLLS